MASIAPRISGDKCIKCRKQFQRGDRITFAHIVEKTCVNPQNPLQMGAMISGEFELLHIDCSDPQLDRIAGGIIIGTP